MEFNGKIIGDKKFVPFLSNSQLNEPFLLDSGGLQSAVKKELTIGDDVLAINGQTLNANCNFNLVRPSQEPLNTVRLRSFKILP